MAIKQLTESVEQVGIDAIRCHPKNPRKGNVELVKESIQVNGFFGALVVQRSTGYILAGNHRWMAAKDLGMQTVPVIYADVTDRQAEKILLADNRTSDVAEYDNKQLADILCQLADLDSLAGTGYDGAFLENLIEEIGGGNAQEEAGEAPEPQTDRAEELRVKWGVERGQIWQVGKHRVMCGDSTSKDDVAQLMDGNKAVLMVTDPPYGVEAIGGTRDPRDTKNFKSGNAIKNDELTGEALELFLKKTWSSWASHISPGAAWYCFYADTETIPVLRSLELLGGARHILVWVKEQFVFGRCDYHYKHEPIAYGWMPGAGHQWLGTHDQSSVWDISRDDVQKKLHPTVKPIDVFIKPFSNHTKQGAIVAEPFTGSGSQVCAAEQTGRVCYGMEIEPKYVAVTLQRLVDMGLEPVLTNGETDKANA